MYKYSSGTWYGNMVDYKREVRGAMIYDTGKNKGSVFEGEFNNNKVDGQGLYKPTNGSVFKGKYVKGKKNGHGL